MTLPDIRAAADRIRDATVRTPLLPCPWAGGPGSLWVKPESLQAVGAFKIRGALNTLARLDPERRRRGVVAYSSGNHARAVAAAARAAGVRAHVVMPDSTPQVKIDGTRAYGAEVVLCGPGEREAVAGRLVTELGAELVPPFDHPDVIAGQGTVGLEIAADLPDVGVVLVPVSGGGLAAGVGTAVRALCPRARVVGVEPELAADAREGLHTGRRVDWPVADRARTMADGLRAQPSELTFAHLRAVLDDIVTVGEDEIRAAMALLARHGGLVAEPSGAVATAAWLFRAPRLPDGPAVAVVSGGNVDPALLAEVLSTTPDGLPSGTAAVSRRGGVDR